MRKRATYEPKFFRIQSAGSYKSAQTIVPLLKQLMPIRSVCDVGCGVGAWVRSFREHGVEAIQGVDGSYVDPTQLLIPPESFHPSDLRQRLSLNARFDLAVSLEVAEHLPPERAASFVEDLTRLAPVVLFSAAIPRQGGTGHLNEQWPDYWAKLFDTHDFAPFDLIRPQIWDDDRIERWYRQNMIIYCRRDYLFNCPQLSQFRPAAPLAIVHPRQYIGKFDELAVKEAFAALCSAAMRVGLRAVALLLSSSAGGATRIFLR
jgi:hypothetical protein